MVAKKLIFYVCIVLQIYNGNSQRRRNKFVNYNNNTSSEYARKPSEVGEMEEDSHDIITVLNKMNERLMSMSAMGDQQLRKLESFEYRLTKLEVQLHEKTETLRSDVRDIAREIRQIEWKNSMTTSIVDAIKSDVSSMKQTVEHSSVTGTKIGPIMSDGDDALTNKVQLVSRNTLNVLNNLLELKSDLMIIKDNTNNIANSTSLFNFVLTEMLTGKHLQTPMAEMQHTTSIPQMNAVGGIVNQIPFIALPQDCSEVTATKSGVYTIKPLQSHEPFFVYCDLETRGGGWTVIQNRYDGSEDFFKGWHDYKNGFGNIAGEFWLGLNKIHQLTNFKINALLIELEDFNVTTNKAYAQYAVFAVGPESDGYPLKMIGGYSGTAGDSLLYHAGHKFSTFDKDHDNWSEGNCAQSHLGAWWYNRCDASNLNGHYFTAEISAPQMYQGMYWKDWRGPSYSLKFSRMMIRPQQIMNSVQSGGEEITTTSPIIQ